MVFAEGDNYRIEIAGGLATCAVWRRPDLDMHAGARCAEEKIRYFRELAQGDVVAGMLFDLREAPPVTGPKTQAALGRMLDCFETASKGIALVYSASIQALQIGRLVGQHAPRHGGAFSDIDAARRWLERRHSAAGSESAGR